MCDLSPDANTVTSVSWNERGNLVAVGTHHGYVTVWDVAASKQVCIRSKKETLNILKLEEYLFFDVIKMKTNQFENFNIAIQSFDRIF